MVSIANFKELNKRYKLDYTDEELKQMREILYLFAEIQISAENKIVEDYECNTIL